MTEQKTPKTEYEILLTEHPELFANEEGTGIRILTEATERKQAEAETGRKTGVVYQDDYILLLRDAVQFPGGRYGTYIRLFNKSLHGGTVILPVTQTGHIVLIRHFRHASRSYHYEIPRGMFELGYTIEANSRKELWEEINAEPMKLTFLGETYPDSGLLGHKVAFYHALVSREELKVNDVEEGIEEILDLTYEEVKEKIRCGEIQDGFTLNALYLAELYGLL